jgi:hypothetical protein
MEQIQFLDAYPVYKLALPKDQCRFGSVSEIAAHLKAQVDAHDMASYIGEFDNYAHTQSLGGEIADNIRAATNLIFCFSPKIPGPDVLAVRPRSFGIVETDDQFVVTFLAAPMSFANELMEQWAEDLRQ